MKPEETDGGEPAVDRLPPVAGKGGVDVLAGHVVEMAARGLFGPAAKAVAEIGPKPFETFDRDANDPTALANVIVGHWLVSGETRKSRKRSREMMRGCTSKCGLLVWYPDWKIRSGKLPATCWACRRERMARSGFAPSYAGGVVVLSEENLKLLQPIWETPVTGSYNKAIDLKSNLKAPQAIREWQEQGLPILCAVLRMTTWGDTFGWKAFVRDCHNAPEKKGHEQVHVGRIDDGQKYVTVTIHPKESIYVFDVDVRTVRTDISFKNWSQAVVDAVNRPAAKPDPKPTAKPATVAGPAPAGRSPAVDLAQLMSLRANLDTLLAAGKGLNEAGQLKAEAARTVSDAEEREREARLLMTEAEVASRRADSLRQTAADRVAELEMKLRNAIVDRTNFEAEHKAAAEHLAAAAAAYGPKKKALDEALANLAAAEKLEAEQVATVGKSEDVRAILMALAKMPANGKGGE